MHSTAEGLSQGRTVIAHYTPPAQLARLVALAGAVKPESPCTTPPPLQHAPIAAHKDCSAGNLSFPPQDAGRVPAGRGKRARHPADVCRQTSRHSCSGHVLGMATALPAACLAPTCPVVNVQVPAAPGSGVASYWGVTSPVCNIKRGPLRQQLTASEAMGRRLPSPSSRGGCLRREPEQGLVRIPWAWHASAHRVGPGGPSGSAQGPTALAAYGNCSWQRQPAAMRMPTASWSPPSPRPALIPAVWHPPDSWFEEACLQSAQRRHGASQRHRVTAARQRWPCCGRTPCASPVQAALTAQ